MSNQNPTILIVEDDDFLSRALLKKCEQENFTVLHANDGEQGLALAVNQKPDCIVTDIMMPLMDGIEMSRQIRSDDWGKDVPIVILTNIGYPGRENEAQAVNAEYLVKANCHLEEIMEVIRSKLEK